MKDKNPATRIPFENEQLEYKRTVRKDTLRRAIVALANTKGGKIVIGIADDLTVTGAKKLTGDDVSNMIRDGCEPPLAPKIDRENYGGKEVITVTVIPGQDTPYRTCGGTYYVRVGATVRIASLSELIDLIVRGRHRDAILRRARIPQLQIQISASMKAGVGFDQALTGIAEISELVLNTSDESTKSEVVGIVDKLLEISCNDDRVIRDLLLLLAMLSLVNLVQNPPIQPLSQELVGRIITIMKRILFFVTIDPKVTDRTEHVLYSLYLVGLGCIWAGYDDQIREVLEAINSNRDKGRRLTSLCRATTDRLVKCAKEEQPGQPRQLGMMIEPLQDRRDRTLMRSLLRNLF